MSWHDSNLQWTQMQHCSRLTVDSCHTTVHSGLPKPQKILDQSTQTQKWERLKMMTFFKLDWKSSPKRDLYLQSTYNTHIYCLIPLHWGISLPRWSDTGCETYPPGNWIEGQDVPKWGQEASIRMKITGTRVCPIWRILSSALEIVHTILCWRRLSSVEKTIS